jgi:hypothetical protein
MKVAMSKTFRQMLGDETARRQLSEVLALPVGTPGCVTLGSVKYEVVVGDKKEHPAQGRITV